MSSKFETMSLQKAGVSLIDCVHKTPAEVSEGNYRYIAIPQMKNCRIDDRDARQISASDFKEWTKKALPQKNDVILSRRCNPGETAFVPEGVSWALGQNLVLLRSDGTKVYPPYLRWMVRSEEWWEQVRKFLNVGAIFDSLKCADIPNFQLSIPSLESQKQITFALDSFENKIELNNQINETLESMMKAIFKEWFIDFGPVKAKAEGKKPFGIDDETASLFPNSFEDSQLGQIPKDWKRVSIGELFEHQIGGGWGKGVPDQTHQKSGFVIRGTDLSKLNLGQIEEIPYRYHKASTFDQRKLRSLDIIFEVSGGSPDQPIGRHKIIIDEIINSLNDDVIPASFCKLIRCKSDHLSIFVDQLFSYNYSTNAFKPWIVQSTGISNFKFTEFLEQFFVVLPTESLLLKYTALVKPLFSLIGLNGIEIKNLKNTRDILLPKLMSGEINI